jgi:hypothetical protein
VWTLEGWLYVAVVIDLFSRQVLRGGRLMIICEHHYVSEHCKWLFGEENQRPVYYITRIEGANMQAMSIVNTWLSVALPQSSRATDNTVVTGNQPPTWLSCHFRFTEETDNQAFDWTVSPR